MGRKTRVVLGWIAGVLVAASALADVAPAPPDSCPAGSMPNTSHAGPYCSLRRCSPEGDCPNGLPCRNQGFCIETLAGGSGQGLFTVDHVRGHCSEGDTCEVGECAVTSACIAELDGPDSSANGLADRIVAPTAGSDGEGVARPDPNPSGGGASGGQAGLVAAAGAEAFGGGSGTNPVSPGPDGVATSGSTAASSGAPSTGGSSGAGTGNTAALAPVSAPPGCSCRSASRSSFDAFGLFAGLGVLASGFWRLRRRNATRD